MKGLAVALLLLVMGISVYNWYEIRTLHEEMARLEAKVDESRSGGVTDQALQKAMDLMLEARIALANTDWTKARNAYETARQQIGAAASSAGQKAGPTLRWLQDEARDLGNQIQQHVPNSR